MIDDLDWIAEHGAAGLNDEELDDLFRRRRPLHFNHFTHAVSPAS